MGIAAKSTWIIAHPEVVASARLLLGSSFAFRVSNGAAV
jgi:hypothetical protein